MIFKYYHGTSSIFLNSIQEHGLGGINPNLDYKNLDVLRFLHKEAENWLTNNAEYLKVRASTKAMATQGMIDVISPNGNQQRCYFRHDRIYVALSKIRAIIYASQTKYGSEIVTRCVLLYELLKSENVDVEIPESINLFGIDKMSENKSEPILIEISEIRDNDLNKEDGKTAKEALNLLRRLIPNMNEKEKFEFIQYCNFELIKPVPIEKLKYYRLSTKGNPGTEQFKYELFEIKNAKY